MKNNVKEVSRRAVFNYSEGNYGVSTTAIDAEIVVDDNGELVYLHAEWVDAVGEFEYDACKKSICDYNEKLNALMNGEEDGDFDKLVEERDRIAEEEKVDFEKYRDVYEEQLKQIILDEMEAHDIDTSEYEDFEEIW